MGSKTYGVIKPMGSAVGFILTIWYPLTTMSRP